jgi:hypothetical protein
VSAADPLVLQVLAEVRELRLEVRQLRADLAGRRARRPSHVEIEAHLAAIASVVGGRLFSVKELLAHAAIPEGAALRLAIIGMVGSLNGKRLGKFLRSIEGEEIGAHRIERVGAERDGISWVLRVCDFESRKTALTVAPRRARGR